METTFKDAIKDHLHLKEQNRWIEGAMPLSQYRVEEVADPDAAAAHEAGNHGDILDPDGAAGWPTAEGLGLEAPGTLWTAQPAFDWGD